MAKYSQEEAARLIKKIETETEKTEFKAGWDQFCDGTGTMAQEMYDGTCDGISGAWDWTCSLFSSEDKDKSTWKK